MADVLREGFIGDTAALTAEFIRIATAWKALETEFATFTARNIQITQADLDRAGYPGITPAEYYTAAGNILAKVQAIVNLIQDPATSQKIYRLLK
jgi:hypothetical protein